MVMVKTSCNRGHGENILQPWSWCLDGRWCTCFHLWKDTKVVCSLSTADKGQSDNLVNRRIKMSGGGVVQVPILTLYTSTTNLWEVV